MKERRGFQDQIERLKNFMNFVEKLFLLLKIKTKCLSCYFSSLIMKATFSLNEQPQFCHKINP
jgi:hypothetical protein